jgi:hypothetical protein
LIVIAEGQVLMLADAAKYRVDEFTKLIEKLHLEAEIDGTEPTIPALP